MSGFVEGISPRAQSDLFQPNSEDYVAEDNPRSRG